MANTKIPSELIADSSITAAKLADGTITTADIADSNVTTAKIADSNVTTAKIGDAQVTTAKITDANVTTGKIADDAVTTAKMASNSVTSDTIASGITLAGTTNTGALSVTGNITTAEDVNATYTLGRYSSGVAYSLLRASANATGLEIRTNAGNAMGRFLNNGTVQLFNNGTSVLTTDSAGINIPGTLDAGTINVTGTVDGIDIAARDAVLTSTTTTAGAALPKAGGTMTGGLSIRGFNGPVLKLGSSGTADPRIDFEDQNSTNLGAGIFLDQDADTLRILRTVSGSATDGIAINASGKVGIGTAAPSKILEVSGPGGGGGTIMRLNQENGSGASGPTMDFGYSGQAWRVGANVYATGDFVIYDTNATTKMIMIKGDGKVGIGTTSPDAHLDISAAAGTTGSNAPTLRLTNSSNVDYTVGSPIGALEYYHSESSGAAFPGVAASIKAVVEVTHGHQVGLAFSTANVDTAATERMRISTSGNVGIGTDDPTAHLEISAGGPTLILNANTQATNKKKIRLAASQYTAGDFNIQQMNDNGTTIALAALTVINGGRVGIGKTSPTGSLHVNTKDSDGADVHVVVQNTTANRIAGYKIQDESGNTGVNLLYDNGSNAATLESPIGALTLNVAGVTTLISGQANLGTLQLSSQAATYQLTGGNNIGYLGYKTGGYHRWFGSDGVEDMRLDAAGNLMVGTTQNIANTDANDGGASAAFFGMSASHTGTGVHISSRRASPLVLNRMAADGGIITFNKAGATLGEIGVATNLNIGSGATRIWFKDDTKSLRPISTAIGNGSDGLISIGEASGGRFKDLHLAGDANIEHLNTTHGLYDLVSSNPSGFAASAAADTWHEITDVNWNGYHTADHVHDHFCIGLFWTSGVTANGYNHRIRIYVPNFSSNVNNPYRPTPANGSYCSTHRDYDGSPSALIFASHHTGMNASGNFKFDARFTNQSTSTGNVPLRLQVKTNTPPASGTSVTMKVWRL